jgi:hypothetical protein
MEGFPGMQSLMDTLMAWQAGDRGTDAEAKSAAQVDLRCPVPECRCLLLTPAL